MTEILKLGRKAFTVSVVATTILWSVGAAALVPSVAKAADVCPALSAGDMIKVVGVNTIYAINNSNEVLPFTDGYAFKTWNVGETYAGLYKSISQDCYESLKTVSGRPLFVGFRPGSVVLKREGSTKYTVILPGNQKAEISLDAAKALYGASFKANTVRNEHWDSVYTSDAAAITEAKAHPGMFVKKDGVTYYVDADSKLVEVTAAGLSANRIKPAYVRSLPASATEGLVVASEKIEAVSVKLADRTQTGVSGTGTPVVPGVPAAGSGLSVSLASDTPAAATIVSDSVTGGQALIPVLKLIFTAPSDGDVTVKTVTLKRGAISADTDISNMYLYEGDTKLASSPSVATTKITFNNASGLFTVSKGTSKIITVKLDLKNNTSAGKTINFGINAASDIVLGSGSASGSFPITGNTFTTALVTDLGNLDLSSVTPSAAATVDPGTTGFEIWRLQAANTDQDIEIRKIIFTIVGSINITDLTNFSVWDGATQIGSTVASMASDKTVTFDWSSAPYLITKGQTKNLSLKTDIVAGTNRTFRASLQNGSDFVAFDKGYNVFLKTDGTDSFAIIEPNSSGTAVNYTINVGTLSQSLASDSPNTNISDGSTNVEMARFNWKANGEDIKVSSLSVSSTATTGTQSTNGTSNDYLANVRLIVDGAQVGSTISGLSTDGVANDDWGSFGNSFIIKAGKTAVIKVLADTTATAISGNEVFVVGLSAGSSNAQGVVSLQSISTTAKNGNSLTVKTGTVSISKNAAFGDKTSTNPTGPVNATSVKVASFAITAGAGEEVDVSQVTLTETAGTCIGTSLQNLVLKNSAGVQLGSAYANPSATCTTANTYTFNFSPAVSIAAGAQYVVDIYADLKAALSATALIKVSAVTATGHNTGTSASLTETLALQTQYIANTGGLLVAADSDTPVATNRLMGATDQVLAKYKFTASSTEAINVSKLVLSAEFASLATGTVQNIRLVDDSTGTQIGSAVSAFGDNSYATGTLSHAVFNNVNMKINKGVSRVIRVVADLTSYEDVGVTATGKTIAPVILASYDGLETITTRALTCTGASSGSSINAAISNVDGSSSVMDKDKGRAGAYAPTSTLYRAKLSVAWASDTPSGASSGSAAQTVAKFVISNLTNAGSYVATIRYINFNLSTSISNASADRTLTIYKDSLSTTALGTTSWAVGQASEANFGDTKFINSGMTDVEISSGASKTFIITLDTTNAATGKTLSIQVGSSDIYWTDGITDNITSMGTDLPLLLKTFTY